MLSYGNAISKLMLIMNLALLKSSFTFSLRNILQKRYHKQKVFSYLWVSNEFRTCLFKKANTKVKFFLTNKIKQKIFLNEIKVRLLRLCCKRQRKVISATLKVFINKLRFVVSNCCKKELKTNFVKLFVGRKPLLSMRETISNNISIKINRY